jgi:hypothetical protein
MRTTVEGAISGSSACSKVMTGSGSGSGSGSSITTGAGSGISDSRRQSRTSSRAFLVQIYKPPEADDRLSVNQEEEVFTRELKRL